MTAGRSNTVWAVLIRFLPRHTLLPAPLFVGKLLSKFALYCLFEEALSVYTCKLS